MLSTGGIAVDSSNPGEAKGGLAAALPAAPVALSKELEAQVAPLLAQGYKTRQLAKVLPLASTAFRAPMMSVLKMDIENFELAAVRGGRAWFDGPRRPSSILLESSSASGAVKGSILHHSATRLDVLDFFSRIEG